MTIGKDETRSSGSLLSYSDEELKREKLREKWRNDKKRQRSKKMTTCNDEPVDPMGSPGSPLLLQPDADQQETMRKKWMDDKRQQRAKAKPKENSGSFLSEEEKKELKRRQKTLAMRRYREKLAKLRPAQPPVSLERQLLREKWRNKMRRRAEKKRSFPDPSYTSVIEGEESEE